MIMMEDLRLAHVEALAPEQPVIAKMLKLFEAGEIKRDKMLLAMVVTLAEQLKLMNEAMLQVANRKPPIINVTIGDSDA